MTWMRNKRLWVGLSFVGLITILRLVLYYFEFDYCFSFDYIKAQRLMIQEYVHVHYLRSVALYITLYALTVLAFLPLGTVITAGGGFLFGIFWGVFYAVIGATVGALGAFLIVRYVVGAQFQRRYANRLVSFNHAVEKQGALYLLSMRCLIVIPFFLVNILAALTRISWWTFIWTTALGMIPVALVFSYAGSQLHRIHEGCDLFSWHLVLAFAFIACLGLVPFMVRFFKRK